MVRKQRLRLGSIEDIVLSLSAQEVTRRGINPRVADMSGSVPPKTGQTLSGTAGRDAVTVPPTSTRSCTVHSFAAHPRTSDQGKPIAAPGYPLCRRPLGQSLRGASSPAVRR